MRNRLSLVGQHLVGVFAVSVLNRDAVGRKQARPLGRQPEQIDHVQLRHPFRRGIDARAVHLFAGDPRSVVLRGVPLVARLGISRQHLLVGEELLLVRFEKLAVDLPCLLRRDVAAGEAPLLVQHLLLEPAEGRFDRLRRPLYGAVGRLMRQMFAKNLCAILLRWPP